MPLQKNMLRPLAIMMFFVVMFAGATVHAQEAIKDRMKARLPSINAIKAKGIVGETNTGYLAFVGSAKEKADMVKAENQDRTKVYTAIAKQQGTTPNLVGKRRAFQIAKKAQAGTFVQDAQGKWYKK